MNTGPVLVDVAVKDLSGAALDWAVAQVDPQCRGIAWEWKGSYMAGKDPESGATCTFISQSNFVIASRLTRDLESPRYHPSGNWSQGGTLIDKYDVELIRFGEKAWYERDPQWNQKPCVGAVIRHAPYDTVSGDIHIEECMTGETRLIAACRAIVVAKLGDVVKVPACLVMP